MLLIFVVGFCVVAFISLLLAHLRTFCCYICACVCVFVCVRTCVTIAPRNIVFVLGLQSYISCSVQFSPSRSVSGVQVIEEQNTRSRYSIWPNFRVGVTRSVLDIFPFVYPTPQSPFRLVSVCVFDLRNAYTNKPNQHTHTHSTAASPQGRVRACLSVCMRLHRRGSFPKVRKTESHIHQPLIN